MIEADAKQSLAALLDDRVEFDAALSRHTSLRIGGPADALVTPKDRDELAQVLAICHARAL
ncbi:MAG: UDP-N-acetylenolpyruvoylglucosamine reductase, partial [Deltaproteobacteria bacterium]|nr:UDP-N-acetylenolpyruvoylglucosamine reductase [Deltaproteobacteria bacterium]